MSYILDALKRADAERERGHVPGLHTHNAPPGAAPLGRKNGWIFAVFLAVAAGAGALAVWWTQTPQPAQSPAASVTGMPSPTPPTSQQTPANPEGNPDPNTPAPLLAPPAEAVLPLLAPPRPAPVTTPSLPVAKSPVASTPPASPEASAAPNTQPPAAPAAPVRSFAELSPEARSALPTVSVSGSTYSQNPAHRMLIANGKVVQEGQEIAPGLVLETIGPRSAVLSHRGQRYSIGY